MYDFYQDGGLYPAYFYPVQGGAGACADIERDARKGAGEPSEDDPQIAARLAIVETQALCMMRDGRFDDATRVMAEWFNEFDRENAVS